MGSGVVHLFFLCALGSLLDPVPQTEEGGGKCLLNESHHLQVLREGARRVAEHTGSGL